MRWLKGDLHGALEAIKLAVSAGSPREPEPSAWAYTRLALYQLQAGDMEEASTSIGAALQLAVDYAPALMVRGRILLGMGKNGEAIASLTRATEISPLPDYLWTLAEALRANDNIAQAEKVEARLAASAATADPRTFALYLASHGHDAELALQLASAELDSRQDVFTHDTVAWAQLATGDTQKARESIRLALAEGTEDGRLFYHAGAIALAAHANAEAFQFFAKAHALQQALLPSERHALSERIATLLRDAPQVSAK
jgi:tetratricopeptide (TPR) repeat protein